MIKKPVNTQFEIQHENKDDIEGIDKAPNPFAMLGANLSREFRIAAGKDPITGKKEPDTTPIKRPASPTSTTEQPKTVAEQLEAPKEKTILLQ